MSLLVLVISIRSWAQLGFTTYILSSALWISALMPILGCAVSLTLPEPRSR